MERIKLLIRGFVSVIIFSSVLFLCAGRLNYTGGWIYFSTTITTTLMSAIALGSDTALLRERSKNGPGAKRWDKLILSASAVALLLSIVVAGFDTGRFEWSPRLHWVFYVSGILLTLTGHSIFITAQRQNKFFSTVVRIQSDRGHTVCDTGLYKIVRHPGYLGMTLSLLGLPMLTGSVWSAVPTSFAIILLWLRTHLEDLTLLNELNGYTAYTQKTRYKLVPFVW